MLMNIAFEITRLIGYGIYELKNSIIILKKEIILAYCLKYSMMFVFVF